MGLARGGYFRQTGNIRPYRKRRRRRGHPPSPGLWGASKSPALQPERSKLFSRETNVSRENNPAGPVSAAPERREEDQHDYRERTARARTELWYREPAEKWTEALPLGNGRLGAMFLARRPGASALNEDTIGRAGPYDRNNRGRVRPGLRCGGCSGPAKSWRPRSWRKMALMGHPCRSREVPAAGDLWLGFRRGRGHGVRRELDLATACRGYVPDDGARPIFAKANGGQAPGGTGKRRRRGYHLR